MPTKLAMPAKPGAKPVYRNKLLQEHVHDSYKSRGKFDYLISGIKKYRVIGIFLSLKSA